MIDPLGFALENFDAIGGWRDEYAKNVPIDDVGTLFTPDTILHRHRQLVANKWDYSDPRKRQTWPTKVSPSDCRPDHPLLQSETDPGL